jgi:hypothetical protein
VWDPKIGLIPSNFVGILVGKKIDVVTYDKTNYKKEKKKKMTKQKTADQAWFISGWAWSPD